MRAVVLAGLMAVWLGMAGGAYAQPTVLEVVAEATRMEEARRTAMIAADEAALNAVFAPTCVYIHSNGIAQSTPEVIGMLTRGEIRYHAFTVQDVAYRVYGTTVVGNGMQSIELTNSGRPFTSKSRYTVVYARIDGALRLVSYQSTSLPEIKMQETRP